METQNEPRKRAKECASGKTRQQTTANFSEFVSALRLPSEENVEFL